MACSIMLIPDVMYCILLQCTAQCLSLLSLSCSCTRYLAYAHSAWMLHWSCSKHAISGRLGLDRPNQPETIVVYLSPSKSVIIWAFEMWLQERLYGALQALKSFTEEHSVLSALSIGTVFLGCCVWIVSDSKMALFNSLNPVISFCLFVQLNLPSCSDLKSSGCFLWHCWIPWPSKHLFRHFVSAASWSVQQIQYVLEKVRILHTAA